jgi:hypothetical protein
MATLIPQAALVSVKWPTSIPSTSVSEFFFPVIIINAHRIQVYFKITFILYQNEENGKGLSKKGGWLERAYSLK